MGPLRGMNRGEALGGAPARRLWPLTQILQTLKTKSRTRGPGAANRLRWVKSKGRPETCSRRRPPPASEDLISRLKQGKWENFKRLDAMLLKFLRPLEFVLGHFSDLRVHLPIGVIQGQTGRSNPGGSCSCPPTCCGSCLNPTSAQERFWDQLSGREAEPVKCMISTYLLWNKNYHTKHDTCMRHTIETFSG